MTRSESTLRLFSRQYAQIENLFSLGRQIQILFSLEAILNWDRKTYLPRSAADWRGEQIAFLGTEKHRLLTSPEFSKAIEAAESVPAGELTAHDRALIRASKRLFERASLVPGKLVGDLARAEAAGLAAWHLAREESDFALLSDALARIIDLRREEAEHVGYEGDIYNFFLTRFDPGLTADGVNEAFGKLKSVTKQALKAVKESDVSPDAGVLVKELPREALFAFQKEILADMGYSFDRGRLDVSTHPFTCGMHARDVRITTRFLEGKFMDSIQSAMHEGGHGLYEQGAEEEVSESLAGFNEGAVSMSLHESQSRLWEHGVGTDRPFWEHWYQKLKQRFPGHGFEDVPLDAFLAAIKNVAPNFIRTESDEVTYNLHIILRTEIEQEILSGRADVRDLPELWNAKVEEYLGLSVPDDCIGVLQDIHWSVGYLGYFPTYSFGNMYMAQILAAVKADFSDYDERVRRGELLFIREWLRERIHRHGSVYSGEEAIQNATSTAFDADHFRKYLNEKYGTLYGFVLPA